MVEFGGKRDEIGLTIYEIVFGSFIGETSKCPRASNVLTVESTILVLRKFLRPLCLLILLVCSFRALCAQRKDTEHPWHKPTASSTLIHESDLDSQLLEDFVLMQKANAGDAVAQAELGYRLLVGRGFPADTVKAAYWVLKAANQGLLLAEFNMGILYSRGWGVPWNPFESFRFFRMASDRDMPEATHILGLLYTENLVVPRNYAEAYRLVKKSADEGYEPAKEIVKEFEKRGLGTSTADQDGAKTGSGRKVDSQGKPLPDSALGFVFLSFHTDTSTVVPDSTLADEALDVMTETDEEGHRRHDRRSSNADTSWFSAVSRAADVGSPEALTLKGRWYDLGLGVERDRVVAAEFYVRAIRHDSPRAPRLLWNLLQDGRFAEELKNRATGSEPTAMFVWAEFCALGYDKLLGDEQALLLLRKASDRNFDPATIELGLCYSSGRWVKQDKEEAFRLWAHASRRGSVEAGIRIAIANLVGEERTEDLAASLATVKSAASEGSLMAEMALAYCDERGIAVHQDMGEAVTLYRRCATRGSQAAYDALRRMYDAVRPNEKEFEIND